MEAHLRRYVLAVLSYCLLVGGGFVILERAGMAARHPSALIALVALPTLALLLYLANFFEKHGQEMVEWAYSSYPVYLRGRFIFTRAYLRGNMRIGSWLMYGFSFLIVLSLLSLVFQKFTS